MDCLNKTCPMRKNGTSNANRCDIDNCKSRIDYTGVRSCNVPTGPMLTAGTAKHAAGYLPSMTGERKVITTSDPAYDIEKVIEESGIDGLKRFIDEAQNKLESKLVAGKNQEVKEELSGRYRMVDYLRAKYNKESEHAFWVGYYCAILDIYSTRLQKQFVDEAMKKACESLAAFDRSEFKQILRAVKAHNSSVSHWRIIDETGIQHNRLRELTDILIAHKALVYWESHVSRYYTITDTGRMFLDLDYPDFERSFE